MKKIWIILGVVALLFLLSFPKYNSLVSADENVSTAWSQVENVLQRRADLVPNLVNTVKGYASHEEKVFTEVTNARARVGQASSVPEKVEANQALGASLGRLLLVAENYPQLKANQNFLQLQDELAGTENRIAVERKRYNEAVRTYNTLVRRFPSNLIAAIFGFERKAVYFEAGKGAKEVPQVQF
ncbi:MAG: LemA family protein [Deltaproteobacteria bacterium CG_4_10_14_0_2_um_filter_43_8]|nr:MAG: LemA family protein [Deltaproteobacteria bacterium CG11_big_fil_rev_8_21_14_0_20_42_23]PJA20239.1 MAG: LemA family protein [Deltaproteobacteria bacterium CG_4_10_14_0_2_um_filter_43_8]PJC64867.1 MAG: LemA family protein [Deltaproteobacteria bacterium CG_4_9_14_0_2_um_filter_42_21]